MSRIGKLPVEVPRGVSVDVHQGHVHVKGPKGELSRRMPPHVELLIGDASVEVRRSSNSRQGRAMHGLCRALLHNMVVGVSKGFERALEINGVGYRAEIKPGVLALTLGYSHPIEILLPEGVTAKVEKNVITLGGIDKEALGQLAAVVRDQRPPEPYKGKGVKYQEETIRRKVGKAGAA